MHLLIKTQTHQWPGHPAVSVESASQLWDKCPEQRELTRLLGQHSPHIREEHDAKMYQV